jgi:hypothetical protein
MGGARALALAWVAAALGTGGPAPIAPQFELRTTDGRTLTAALEAVESDGTVVLASDKPARFGPRQWLTLRREKIPLPPLTHRPLVLFANGDRVPLAEKPALKIAGNRLHFRPGAPIKAADTLDAPLATVAVLWLGDPEGTDDPAWMLRQLQVKRPATDLVLLRDGSRVEGTVTALDEAAGCKVRVGKRTVDVPWADVAAVAFNGELLTPGLPDGPYLHVVLGGGGRISLTSPRVESGKAVLRGKTLAGATVEVALADVVALDVRRGAAVYLSDLKPLRYEHTPYAGTTWALAADACATGHELRLDGSTFDKGLGLHAEARVTYSLGGKYRWFEARVGLDPAQGKKGRVRLRVLADGKELDLGWNKELSARDEPLALRLDVRAVKELTLEVLFGSYGDVQSNVNWAEARLVE